MLAWLHCLHDILISTWYSTRFNYTFQYGSQLIRCNNKLMTTRIIHQLTMSGILRKCSYYLMYMWQFTNYCLCRMMWLEFLELISCDWNLHNCNAVSSVTPGSRILIQKLTVTQPAKEFTASYGVGKFITVFTRPCLQPIFWAKCIQSLPSNQFWYYSPNYA